MRRVAVALIAALVLATPGVAGDEDKDKGKKPQLRMRATPRFAFSPATILFTAELKGGDDVEELYCPEIEWEWGDGGKSVTEADCDPWEPGTRIERRFTGRHEYRRAGRYRVQVILSKAGDKHLTQNITVEIRAGLGDSSMDY